MNSADFLSVSVIFQAGRGAEKAWRVVLEQSQR